MSVFTNPASSTPDETRAYVAALLGLLGDDDALSVLRQTPTAIERFLAATPPAILGTPEAPGKWSIAAVLQHLADSDLVSGFRFRMVLSHDRPSLQGYDQDLWSDRLRYREAVVDDALDQFLALRRANLRMWDRLGAEDLRRVSVHAERGEESVAHMLRLYAGHDRLHLRQLERIRAALT